MNLIPVLVTTSFRGVFFGFAKEEDLEKPTIELQKCRNVISWHDSRRGFLGLASSGPSDKCRIGEIDGPSVILHAITSVSKVSEKALEVWNLVQ